jgi:hypothetical protein
MKTTRLRARFVGFGEVEIDGLRYERDVVIVEGRVRRRDKGPSKRLRDRYGHTPLTAAEDIPWDAHRLIIGTGAAGALPIDESVRKEARRRGVELVTVPTKEACALLSESELADVAAILHVTC